MTLQTTGLFGFDKRVTWSPTEDQMLTRDWIRGVAIRQIAVSTGKSIGAVKHRRILLELPPRRRPGVITARRRNRFNVYLNDTLSEAAKRRAFERQQRVSDYLAWLVRRDAGQ